ncbi:hypothetical protein OQA88_8800 [Cercophora sp. LCS_1]
MPGRLDNGGQSARKRPRIDTLDGEEELVEVREARSNLRGDNYKRVRVSEAGPSKGGRRQTRDATPDSDYNEGHEENDEEANGAERERFPSSPLRTQYDELRDGDFTHLQHEMEDDQRATQRLRFRPNRLGDNAVADNGIIEAITCVNFMCHTRLYCELGPLLNFIVGENGSGKSAILTAVTLCLGGKASSTNRGGSLKDFVKEGQDKALLIVKLKNQGDDAYKHDLYGDSIVVERHFSKTGSSGFRVKSKTGTTISTKRQEIEEIVEYFALQVDNPLNVLSQDNARQFLNDSTKAQKYKFFIEGVQLQQLDNDYRLIKESLDQTMAKIPELEATVKRTEEALTEMKRKKEAMGGQQLLRAKIRSFRNQLIWFQVVEQEKRFEAQRRKVEEIEQQIVQATELAAQRRENLNRHDAKLEGLRVELEEAEKDLPELKKAVKAAEPVLKTRKDEIILLQGEERDAHNKLMALKDRMAGLDDSIRHEERRLQEKNGAAHTAANERLNQAKAHEEDITGQIAAAASQAAAIRAQKMEAEKALKDKNTEFEAQKKQIGDVQEKISSAQSGGANKFSPYEPGMPRLVKMIEQESRFQTKPIGPLGLHVRLLKAEWSPVLESLIGSSLNGFIVTNHRDRKLLEQCIERSGIKDSPVLLTSLKGPLNLEGREPEQSFTTVLRVLRFNNDMVRDQLIMTNSIEQLLLIPKREAAEQVMFRGAKPRNVKAAVCFKDGSRTEGLTLNNSGGSISTNPIRGGPKRKHPRMLADIDEYIAVQKEQLASLEAEYQKLLGERQALQKKCALHNTQVATNERETARLKKDLEAARRAITRAQSDVDDFDGEDGKLQGLLTERDELKEQYQTQGTQMGAITNRKLDKNRDAEAAKRNLAECRAQLNKAQEAADKFSEKIARLEANRRIVLTELNETEARIEVLREDKAREEERARRRAEDVAEMTANAQSHVPVRVEIPEGETEASLEKQHNALKSRYDREEKKHGMKEGEIEKLLNERTRARNEAAKTLKSVVDMNQQMKQTLGLRLHRWRLFQRFISAQSRCNFQYLLSERGFRGKLLFDHQRRYLDLQVEPDKTEKGANGRSTKTLSGGEKSFSSICLLLSIWEAMGSPLRCLDEFDVFMDNVNRAISTNMLITAARRSVNRQYIFITPNAIEGRANLDKDVKIIRLTDPRQQRLADF